MCGQWIQSAESCKSLYNRTLTGWMNRSSLTTVTTGSWYVGDVMFSTLLKPKHRFHQCFVFLLYILETTWKRVWTQGFLFSYDIQNISCAFPITCTWNKEVYLKPYYVHIWQYSYGWEDLFRVILHLIKVSLSKVNIRKRGCTLYFHIIYT